MFRHYRAKYDPSLLFFIIIYLLLFYDGTAIGLERKGDSSSLFFIIIYLLLFYDGTAIGLERKGDSTALFFILVFLLVVDGQFTDCGQWLSFFKR